MTDNETASVVHSTFASDVDANPSEVAESLRIEEAMSHLRAAHSTMRYASTRYLIPDFEPAYRYGISAFLHEPDKHRTFESITNELASGWAGVRGASRLAWKHARHAVEAGWHRMQCTTDKGDLSRDDRRECD
jgi:hypothetical protein